MLTRDELSKAYWWEIKIFYENGATVETLKDLLEAVYQGGYHDGKQDREYD